MRKLWTRHHISVLIFVSIGIALVCSVVFFEYNFRNHFYPNVVLGGQTVGGKTYEEVLARIRLVGEGLAAGGLQLIVPTDHTSTTITIPQQSTGLTPDVVVEYFNLDDYEQAVADAYGVGRTGSLGRRVREQLLLLLRPKQVPLPVTVREAALTSLLEREMADLLKKPHDAHFERRGASIVLVPETTGESIDIPSIIPSVVAALTSMQTNRLQLTVRPKPAAVTTATLEPFADFARSLSSMLTFALTYQGQEVYASGATVATWLTVMPATNTLAISRDKLAEFVRLTINEQINDAPVNSRFEMRDSKLVEIAPGKAGSVAGIEAVATQLEQVLRGRLLQAKSGEQVAHQIVRIPVEFVTEAPRITASTIAAYDIRTLVGSAATSFKGSSQSRINNIKTGAARVSGLLIAPGSEFSLVKAIGEVTEESGFEKEYVIKGDRSVKEAGGGLCQLATTVFRALLNAGLPVTERQNHSYVVGYYGPGLDATIYGPWPDLKFVNDTGEYLLFQMHVDGTDLVAEFYGKKDGRQIATTEPVLSDYIDPPPPRYIPAPDEPWGKMDCTDHERRGLTAVATTTVTYADGHERVHTFSSVYQPWPKICLVGIKLGE